MKRDPLNRESIDSRACAVPRCTHTAKDHALIINSACHRGAGVLCTYRDGVLTIDCIICGKEVCAISVATGSEAALQLRIDALLMQLKRMNELVAKAGAPCAPVAREEGHGVVLDRESMRIEEMIANDATYAAEEGLDAEASARRDQDAGEDARRRV